MKPVIISTLCFILLISIWSFFYFHSGAVLNELSEELSGHIYNLISDENWDSAVEEINNTSKLWKKHKAILYMLTNHSVIREADISFGRLSEYIKNEEISDSHAEIGVLQELFLSIRQSEAFTIDNIL